MTTLKPNMKTMEEKRKMKKLLILALALTLVFAFAANAMALSYTDTDDGKATDFNSRAKTVTDQAYADPDPHADKFYLPGDPSTGTKIHSNYTENTDACAACHFTHSAEGPRLLQWNSIYKTCAACHDGSLGAYTYDVFDGKIGTTTKRTFGGLFGSTPETMNTANTNQNANSLSNHMPDGYMALSAAPGAEANADKTNDAFDCASCHTPHGQGGNARILSPDPGKTLISQVFANATNRAANVKQFAKVLNVVGTKGTDGTKYWIEGYPYNKITAVVKLNAGSTLNDLTFRFNADTDKLEVASGGSLVESGYTIDYAKGEVNFTTAPAVGDDYVVVRVPGIFVAMKISGYMTAAENVDYVAKDVNAKDGATNSMEGINAYCGACHGLYNTQGSVTPSDKSYDFVGPDALNHGSGFYGSKGAYRHQVGFIWNKQWTGNADYIKFAYPVTGGEDGNATLDTTKPVFNCLSCHYAHGVDQTLWSETTTGATFDVAETYGSSALKRLPNMGTCESCHNKSAGNNKDTLDDGSRYY